MLKEMPFQEKLSENQLREDLAFAYRTLAKLGLDDLTYTHLSARLPGSEIYYIYPLGQLFSEVTASSLLSVTLEGEVIQGKEAAYNQTGYVIHSAIYKARPDISAIFHLHTLAGVAVSAMQCGLLPISQFAFHFYEGLSHHTYDSLALSPKKHGAKLAEDLGPHNKAMLLQNHGTLTCGSTLQEAFFYAYYLEKACKVQTLVLNSGQAFITPQPEICRQARKEMRAFEADLGARDWEALKR